MNEIKQWIVQNNLIKETYPFCCNDVDICGCFLCQLACGEIDDAPLLNGGCITVEDLEYWEPQRIKDEELIGYWNLIACFKDCPRLQEWAEGEEQVSDCGCDFCEFFTRRSHSLDTLTGLNYSRSQDCDCC